MGKTMERKNVIAPETPEMEDAREFAELYERLSKSERQQIKGIIIGIQIAKEAGATI